MMVITDGSLKRWPFVVLKLLFSIAQELGIDNLLVIWPDADVIDN